MGKIHVLLRLNDLPTVTKTDWPFCYFVTLFSAWTLAEEVKSDSEMVFIGLHDELKFISIKCHNFWCIIGSNRAKFLRGAY